MRIMRSDDCAVPKRDDPEAKNSVASAAHPTRDHLMNFAVHFLRDVNPGARPRIVRSVELEADDLYSVVSRVRIMLESADYETAVNAFEILGHRNEVIYQECRGCIDQDRLQAMRS